MPPSTFDSLIRTADAPAESEPETRTLYERFPFAVVGLAVTLGAFTVIALTTLLLNYFPAIGN
jgi:hypothetical protein